MPSEPAGRGTAEHADPFCVRALRADLETLVSFGPRSPADQAALERTTAFLHDALTACGYEVTAHRFDTGPGDCNLLAERAGTDPAAPVLEIGAHFDTVPGSPGADDNGSGVVGLLAIARWFARRSVQRPVRFCFFGREETGLLGSEAHQRWLDAEARPFAGSVVFEMIGCRNRAPGSQRAPFRIPLLFWPPRTGDFIALIANRPSWPLAGLYEEAAKGHGVRVHSIKALGGVLKDAMRSDHASYWRAGRPAVMLTDTANFRNPHYHGPGDTVDSIDFDFLAGIAGATAVMAGRWASAV